MRNTILSPEQCRGARGLLGLSQIDLCALAGISHKPLVDFEKGNTRTYISTLKKLLQALESAGVEFIPENGGGPGVRLRETK